MQKGMTEVTLNDFYQHQSIHITLKKNLSPQENAAHYYSKYKVQRKQHQKLLEDLNTLKNKLADLMKENSLAAETKDLAELPQPIVKNKHSDNGKELPFRKFEKDGFTILVGKNAASNDLLTMKHAHKNDLWLHTHGVSGSHVVIKHIAGKEFTKQVIEFAASIAAYYSKLKGSQLVPVSYTLKKHVRKRKGAAPGEVIIEREKVAMVKPMLEN
jgi:predicted ribosome quality control (RQC) complex YloA/Tae2 family protein